MGEVAVGLGQESMGAVGYSKYCASEGSLLHVVTYLIPNPAPVLRTSQHYKAQYGYTVDCFEHPGYNDICIEVVRVINPFEIVNEGIGSKSKVPTPHLENSSPRSARPSQPSNASPS